MLNDTQIKAREIIIDQIEKAKQKLWPKANKEKAKRDDASITYQGITYKTENDLMEAYACDAFSSSVYDRLLDKLDKARGRVDSKEFTPTECLILELDIISNNLKTELHYDREEKKRNEATKSRLEELVAEGYSLREAETIVSNEELMRFE